MDSQCKMQGVLSNFLDDKIFCKKKKWKFQQILGGKSPKILWILCKPLGGSEAESAKKKIIEEQKPRGNSSFPYFNPKGEEVILDC